MTVPNHEFNDIQGLVWSGFGSLTEACFVLLRVTDADAARAWLGTMLGSVTTIEQLRHQRLSRALQIALTAEGMRALGVATDILDGFSAEFISGMTGDEGRSRRLGDVASSAPSVWRWGGASVPHLVLMLYTDADLDTWRLQIEAGLGSGLAMLDTLFTSDMGG
jgi:hypothetical protein